MAEKKKQHVIPRCYVRAWCDPRTPPKQQPYIWRISKDGVSKKKRSPEKSFTATDKYTIRLPNGQRNLIIEDTLSKIEGHFVKVLSRVRKREKLTTTDRARVCVFTAAMHARTTAMGDHWQKFQRELHEKVATLEKAHNAEPSLSLEIAQYAEQAHQHLIAAALDMEGPLLFRMEMTILVTDDEIGFITSDTPCVWFNPNLHKFPPFYRSPGLAQKDIEVTLPLTPQHLLVISHHKYPQYVDVLPKALDELNRRTRFHCVAEFVSRNGETRPYWFDPGKQPEDTWEKSEEAKRVLARADMLEDARKSFAEDSPEKKT